MSCEIGRVAFVSAAIWVTTASTTDAQRRSDTTSVVPEPLADRVAESIATQWRVDPGRIVLEWNRFGGHDLLSDSTPFALRGQPNATRFSVVFSPVGSPPLAVGLRAGLMAHVPVATRPLTPGQVLDKPDVSWGESIVWGNDVLDAQSSELPVGWTVRTNIGAGEPVTLPAARPPPAIRAGQEVEVVWQRGVVGVTLYGIALNNAATGEHVRIRLHDRRGNARGIAVGNGRVRLVEKSE